MHAKQERVDSLNYFNDTVFLTPDCVFACVYSTRKGTIRMGCCIDMTGKRKSIGTNVRERSHIRMGGLERV